MFSNSECGSAPRLSLQSLSHLLSLHGDFIHFHDLNTISTQMIPKFLFSAQNSPLIPNCLNLSISDFTCPKPQCWNLLPNLLLLHYPDPKAAHSFYLLRSKTLGSCLTLLFPSHPTSIHQQIVVALPSKYTGIQSFLSSSTATTLAEPPACATWIILMASDLFSLVQPLTSFSLVSIVSKGILLLCALLF